MSLTNLYIRDKVTGKVHRIGDDRHDQLTIDKNGLLRYCNLQNGDGCVLTNDGSVGGYEFVPNEDDDGYNCDPRVENS